VKSNREKCAERKAWREQRDTLQRSKYRAAPIGREQEPYAGRGNAARRLREQDRIGRAASGLQVTPPLSWIERHIVEGILRAAEKAANEGPNRGTSEGTNEGAECVGKSGSVSVWF
jgi:hypothetical protein